MFTIYPLQYMWAYKEGRDLALLLDQSWELFWMRAILRAVLRAVGTTRPTRAGSWRLLSSLSVILPVHEVTNHAHGSDKCVT